MTTECKDKQIEFQVSGSRPLVADFGGGQISSDGGALLLREVDRAMGFLDRFALCFTDHRDPERIEHSAAHLVAQRVYALALGYEDLNDHETLRRDPLLAALVGKPDPSGEDRARERDKGAALAGKSTLNRLELTPAGATAQSRYQKIVCDEEKVERFFVQSFLDVHASAPETITLDLDATDDPLHGNQEGRFFHAYYGGYCYLPLYVFCGDFLLASKLRPAHMDASHGALEEVQRIAAQIRESWPKVRIILRADSGFMREEIMAWCERESQEGRPTDYVFGLARNSRLAQEIERQLEHARRKHLATNKPRRCFRDFRYRTRNSWSRTRRVVGKAEWMDKGANPRFVVTSLPPQEMMARDLYEKLYCARGEMENRIKEQQLDLFADRTSAATMRANQLRLWFSSVAYVLLNHLRHAGLKGTAMEQAQVGTIRVKLLKVGALVRLSVRRVWVRLSSAWPQDALFATVVKNLRRAYPLRAHPLRT